MDFVILILPIPMIWGLHRAWQDRLALNGVFALGAFVCFASIYRIVVLFWITPQDPTYTVYQATLWTHIEPSVGLICSNLPIIRGLFPVLRLNRSKRNTTPYYINTSISNSNMGKSSPRSPDLDYLEMEAGMYDTQTERSNGHFLGDDLHPLNIQVRTEIDTSTEESTTTPDSFKTSTMTSTVTSTMAAFVK